MLRAEQLGALIENERLRMVGRVNTCFAMPHACEAEEQ